MVKLEKGGEYLKFDTSKDGDIVEITGEGSWEEITVMNKAKQVFNLPVLINGKKLTYTPSTKPMNELIDAFGEETKEWINKKFQIVHIEGKMFIKPLKMTGQSTNSS